MPNHRILIVDDNETICVLIAEVIGEMYPQLEVKWALDADQALGLCQQQGVAVLFTDYEMPQVNGLQLAKAVRRLSPTTFIVLMSGHGTQVLTDGLFSSRYLDGFLAKPFSVFEIFRILDSALQQAAVA